MNEELDTHVAMWVDHLVARGVPPDVAARQARERFGDFDAARKKLRQSAKEREGTMRRREWFGMVRQDVVFAVRQARRELGTTVIIVLTLGLGVGANAVMFGVVDRLLLSPPSNAPAPDRLARPVFERTSKFYGHSETPITNWPTYRRLAGAASFSAVAGYTAPFETSVGRGGSASSVRLAGASASLFSVMGARPAAGRFYGDDEDSPPAGAPVAVVSYDYAQNHPGILGDKLLVSSKVFAVVGVAPRGFTGAELNPVDVWIPLAAQMGIDGRDFVHDEGSYNVWSVARIKDGVAREAAAAEASAIFRAHLDTSSLLLTSPPRVQMASIIPGRGAQNASTAKVAAWLLGVAAVVLLIACANVATLLLIRAIRRRGEIAVRLALGISRRRLLFQLSVESAFLVVMGAVAALAVSRAAHSFIYAVLLPDVASDAGGMSSTWLLVLAIALGTTGLTMLAPAAYAKSIDIANSLKSAPRAATAGPSRLRAPLGVAQVALSVMLLVGAGLFLRSLDNMRDVPLGLDVGRLVLATVEPPRNAAIGSGPLSTLEFWKDAKRRVKAQPSVQNVTLIGIPFRTAFGAGFSVPGRKLPRFTAGGPYVNGVDASYFTTLGTQLLSGRAFTDADGPTSQRVAIVNKTLARALAAAESPIGMCVKPGADAPSCATIVGVVEDIHRSTILEPEQPQYYLPLSQWPLSFGVVALIARSRSSSSQRTVDDTRRAIQGMSNDLSYPMVDSFAHFIDPQLASWLLGARMFSLFGGLAFVIAMIGFYGLLAHSVVQRRHELCIRSALGARTDQIMGLVVKQGARIVVPGVVTGLALAALLAGRVSPLLFGVGPRDVATYASVALLAAAVALVAALLPARRAASVAPIEALRAE